MDAPGFEHDRPLEGRQNLLDMVGDHDHRRACSATEMLSEPAEEALARPGIHPVARLVENQQQRIGDERAGHHHLLPLPLRKDAEGAVGESGAADPLEFLKPPRPIGLARLHPHEELQSELRKRPRHDRIEGQLVGGNLPGD